MKAQRIDFAAPSLRRTVFHTHPAVWLLAALALLLCAGAAIAGWQLLAQQRDHAAQLRMARLRAVTRSVAPVAAASRIAEPQATAVNAAVLQLNLPWRALHDALAAATPPEVALLALDPDARKRVLRVTAEAKDSEAMIGYVEQLKRQELFASVVLTRHEVNDQDPNHPLRFQIDALWSAP